MANYILLDGPPARDFIAGLEETSRMRWTPLSCDGRAHVAKWRRLLNYFIFPMRFILGCRNIAHVVAWQQFYGITTAFYNRLLPLHRDMRISVMTFIYKPKRGIAGRLFHRYVDTALRSRNVTDIIVFSQSEVDYCSRLFPGAAHKFRYMPLGISRPQQLPVTRGGYIFTAGVSNRDYDFLCDTLAGTPYTVRIACPGVKVPHGATNIQVLSDCYEDDMLRQLAGCDIVVIPLRDRNISSGQLMLLQAMQMGKPVIVTRTDTLSTYVDDGSTAIFIDNTPSQLLEAIARLYDDTKLYDDIARNAARKVATDFSEHALGINIGNLASIRNHGAE